MLNIQFLAKTKSAFRNKESLASVAVSILDEHNHSQEALNALEVELAAADQSTQATLNTNPIMLEQRETDFAQWYQSGLNEALKALED